MKFKKYIKEAVTRDDPLQDLADVVGKGGRMPHKPTAELLKKSYNIERDVAELKIQDIIDSLEDENFHTEAAILEALSKGDKKKADILVMIAKEHHKIGHLPADLSTLRYFIISGMKKFQDYWERIGSDMYRGIKLSPATMKIVKKLPKKEMDYFLSLFGE